MFLKNFLVWVGSKVRPYVCWHEHVQDDTADNRSITQMNKVYGTNHTHAMTCKKCGKQKEKSYKF